MSEPTTVLTDCLLALVALAVAWRLVRAGSGASLPGRLWGASFAALGVAALAGGTWHGIPPHLLPALRHELWSVTYVAIGAADLLILAGATRAMPLPLSSAAVITLLTARFLVYAGLVVGLREFRFVAIEFGVTVLLLLAFALDLARRRQPAAAFAFGGAVLSLAGGLVLALRVSPHPRFNQNDLFHVIQICGVWLFFQAALVLRSGGAAARPGPPAARAVSRSCGLRAAARMRREPALTSTSPPGSGAA